jgi:endonuclease-3 related protein
MQTPDEPRDAGTEAPARGFAAVYRRLLAAYGPQHWWPAESPFEVMIGAILTQNTAWTNVERALAGLGARVPLAPDSILALPEAELAAAIRPAGYYNIKARRLRAFCAALLQAGGQAALADRETAALRDWLLGINGVGPETADDILLYAFERPVFVVDAYTRRVFQRLALIDGRSAYEVVRRAFESALGADPALYNEYHALIVRHAKDICRARRPRCTACCLAPICPSAAADAVPQT